MHITFLENLLATKKGKILQQKEKKTVYFLFIIYQSVLWHKILSQKAMIYVIFWPLEILTEKELATSL